MSNPNELQQRAISGAILGIVVITAIIAGGLPFALLIVLAALAMHEEWTKLVEGVSVYWRWAGFAYVALPCAALIWLRTLPPIVQADNTVTGGGLYSVLYIMLIVWATDIGAYAAGRTIGGPKIAPSISPSKTWAGLGGGMLAAALVGVIMSFFVTFPSSFFSAVGMGMLLAVTAQAGDFFESWLKRRAGVKDSGTLIPGHGGILDRVDGLVTAAPVYALFLWLAS